MLELISAQLLIGAGAHPRLCGVALAVADSMLSGEAARPLGARSGTLAGSVLCRARIR